MRQVHIFTIQRPVGNPIPVKRLYKEFGTNIPHYLPLEGGDYNGPQYLFCIDSSVDYESICEKYNYKYYPPYKFQVEESKFNNKFRISEVYGVKDTPYRLRENELSSYSDTDSE